MRQVNNMARNKSHIHSPTDLHSPWTRKDRPVNHGQLGRPHFRRLPRVQGCCVPQLQSLRSPQVRRDLRIMIPTRGDTISTAMMMRRIFSSTTGLLPLLHRAPRHRRMLTARLPRRRRQTRVPRRRTPRPCRPHPVRCCLLPALPHDPSPRRSLVPVQGVRHQARREASISVRTSVSGPGFPYFTHLLLPTMAFTGKLGLLPKRPISLVRPQSPPATSVGAGTGASVSAPRVATADSESTSDSSTDREEPEFLRNPFEDPR